MPTRMAVGQVSGSARNSPNAAGVEASVRPAFLAAVVAVALLCAAPAGAAKRCPGGFIENALVSVYERSDAVVGCYKPTGRRTELADPSGADLSETTIDDIAIAGRYVGFVERIEDLRSGDDSGYLRVFDLKQGERTTSWPVGRSVADLDLTRGGSFACLNDYSSAGRRMRSVIANGTVLDSAPRGHIRSLKIVRGRVTWLRDGRRRSARLPR
jgi:hypothetical protein